MAIFQKYAHAVKGKMSQWFPLIILKIVNHKVFILHILIGHN
jgi:hypothetical protein